MIEIPETTVSIRMSLAMRDALEELAVETDMSIGQLVREALQRFLDEVWSQPHEVTVASSAAQSVPESCREAVSAALPVAKDWQTMQAILATHGCEYRAHGGGLAVFDTADGRYLCKASAVGPGYSMLIKRFRAPFPGHPHSWLADRILSKAS